MRWWWLYATSPRRCTHRRCCAGAITHADAAAGSPPVVTGTCHGTESHRYCVDAIAHADAVAATPAPAAAAVMAPVDPSELYASGPE